MVKSSAKSRSNGWKLAASLLAMSLGGGLLSQANAQEAASGPDGAWDAAGVVPNLNQTNNQPPPAGILDLGVTGVGNVITSANPATTTVGVCTGTLINPRTVIFAAHCVNTRAASDYGAAQGGTALSVGFNDANLPAIVNWINNGFRTNTSLNIFNANQVWYDPRSLALGPTQNFLQADVAIATLDTPALGIPTWALLFSPLTEATHVSIIGYGNTGNAVQGAITPSGFRRRAAENMLDSLASLNDRNAFLFGSAPGPLVQNLYSLDFDNPANPPYNPAAGSFDFDLFGGLDTPREGITAPGDSGGPLVVDQQFDRPVVAGVLSGSSRFFGPQPFSTYGTQAFYQPLFLFWDVIVQNNPYVYASALAGDGSWLDASHWVQDMDPNYMVVRNGALANDLPDTPALGVSGDSVQFGQVCFLTTCASTQAAGAGANSTGPGLVIAGGPGSTNFVPNNIDPDRFSGRRARYFDVTLREAGTTWLDGAVTIDRFSMANGYATLDVKSGGSLRVLGDLTVGAGWLNVDGTVRSGEALFVQGILTGRGLFDPTFFTSVASAIAPNGVDVGTLSIQGDVVLASGSNLFIEVNRNGADQLRILADITQGTAGDIDLGGALRVVRARHGAAPRHGQTFDIVLADGLVTNEFDQIFAEQTGSLRPLVTYLSNAVRIELRAGEFANVIYGNRNDLEFARVLDDLREGSYNLLYDLYGELDVMDFDQLSGAVRRLNPSSLFDARGLMAMQDDGFSTLLQDRLSLIARSDTRPSGLSIVGAAGDVLSFGGDNGLAAASELAFASQFAQTRTVATLPNGVSAFIAGGYDESNVSNAAGRVAVREDESMRTWRMSGGVEQQFGSLTLGVAAAYSRGETAQASTSAQTASDVAQSAVYGVYDFGNGAYVSGLVGMGASETQMERRFFAGALDYRMQGSTSGALYVASIEAGYNIDIGDSFTLTPHVSIEQMSAQIDGFSESGGEAALLFDDQRYYRMEARAGASFAGSYATAAGWQIAPSADVAIVANLGGDEDGGWARFAAAPDRSFYLSGAERDDLWGEVSLGVSASRGETSVMLQVEQSVAREELHDNRLVARLAQRF